jgi:hypothetical protein
MLNHAFVAAGMALLIFFSDVPTFDVVLNLKQLRWHAAVKTVLPLIATV